MQAQPWRHQGLELQVREMPVVQGMLPPTTPMVVVVVQEDLVKRASQALARDQVTVVLVSQLTSLAHPVCKLLVVEVVVATKLTTLPERLHLVEVRER
jgi:hypothetical protein